MEGLPQTGPDKKPSDSEKKKKDSRTGASVRFPGFAEVASAKEGEQRVALSKESARDKLLENLGLRKEEPADQPAAEATSKPVEAAAETPAESTEAMGAATERTDTPKKPEEEPLSSHELAPNELSGGEVIIHLNGDQSLAERVIPLHEEEQAPEVGTPSVEQPAAELPEANAVEMPALDERSHDPVAEAYAEPAGAGGDLPPVPPRPPAAASEPPLSPRAPVQQPYYEASAPYVASVTEAGSSPATKEDVENALRNTQKASQGRGVLAGLLVAGGYEHFKHKRREKKLEKQLKKQSKEFATDRKDRHFYFEEQQTQQAKNEQRLAAVEKRVEKVPTPKPTDATEQLQVPEGHHIETSAWHSIEVDSKTGKAVETPAFAYGQEYYRERAKESAPALHRNTAAGEVALVAAATQSDQASVAAKAATIPLATTQGAPASRSSLMDGSNQKASSGTPAEPLWPWLIALAVIVVCLAFLLG